MEKSKKRIYDDNYLKDNLPKIGFRIRKELKESLYSKFEEDNIRPIDFFKYVINEYLKGNIKVDKSDK